MKKVFIITLLLFTTLSIFGQTAPNVVMEDIEGVKYAPLYDLLDEGHYIALYMLSST